MGVEVLSEATVQLCESQLCFWVERPRGDDGELMRLAWLPPHPPNTPRARKATASLLRDTAARASPCRRRRATRFRPSTRLALPTPHRASLSTSTRTLGHRHGAAGPLEHALQDALVSTASSRLVAGAFLLLPSSSTSEPPLAQSQADPAPAADTRYRQLRRYDTAAADPNNPDLVAVENALPTSSSTSSCGSSSSSSSPVQRQARRPRRRLNLSCKMHKYCDRRVRPSR